MSKFETASFLGTEGGDDDMPRPSSPLGATYSDGVGRDEQTDAKRMTEVTVGTEDDGDLDDSGWQCASGVSTIGNEKRNAGWTKVTMPSGAMPNPQSTAGTRGAQDIGQI